MSIFPSDMDDPCDRPEFFDNHTREIEEHAQRSVEILDDRANEKHDIMENF